MVALEGQGQDELFDILAGSERPSGGELLVDGAPVSFRHPADAIRAGLVYVAADRAEALLMQRSVRENIALPRLRALRAMGPDRPRPRATTSRRGRRRGCRSTPAPAREVRRLSGGNQQKVTIARWVAGGVRTMLCFDPTRGIDIRTKHQIYMLLRDLAEAGAAVLLYTSELKEIQLVCDRAIVIFGGRVVAEIAAARRRRAGAAARRVQPAVGRRACPRRSRPRLPRPEAAVAPPSRRRIRPRDPGRAASRRVSATTRRRRSRRGSPPPTRRTAAARRNTWTLGLLGFLVLLLVFTKLIQPNYGVDRHPGPRDLGRCPGPRGRRPRRSSSSPAASTSRSAR